SREELAEPRGDGRCIPAEISEPDSASVRPFIRPAAGVPTRGRSLLAHARLSKSRVNRPLFPRKRNQIVLAHRLGRFRAEEGHEQDLPRTRRAETLQLGRHTRQDGTGPRWVVDDQDEPSPRDRLSQTPSFRSEKTVARPEGDRANGDEACRTQVRDVERSEV